LGIGSARNESSFEFTQRHLWQVCSRQLFCLPDLINMIAISRIKAARKMERLRGVE